MEENSYAIEKLQKEALIAANVIKDLKAEATANTAAIKELKAEISKSAKTVSAILEKMKEGEEATKRVADSEEVRVHEGTSTSPTLSLDR